MLRRIQARNYRCLRNVDVELDRDFHVLVGANGSGKSALLDVVAFASDLITSGLDVAIGKRTKNLQDLVWGRPGGDLYFSLALEFDLSELDEASTGPSEKRFRYELGIGDTHWGDGIHHECGLFLDRREDGGRQSDRTESDGDASILTRSDAPDDVGYFMLQSLTPWENAYYRHQHERKLEPAPGPFSVAFDLRRSVFDRIPESRGSLSVANYARRFLTRRIHPVSLETGGLNRASPPLSRRAFLPSGSNLPWIVQRMQEEAPDRFEDWLGHVCMARPDIESLRVVDRDDDRHAYLTIQYRNGVCAPSWSVSDGTLRLLALTLIAYLPDPGRLYLLEEPENGVHPLAIEAICQSLSSIYGSQVLATTHSPVLLRCMEPGDIICFAKDSSGATVVLPGDRHPMLADWKSTIDNELVFATEFFE